MSLSDAERRAQYRPPRPAAEQRDESWRPRAACAGLPSDWWVPFHETTGRGQKPSPTAVATCAACPVREECLAYAVKWREHGYWGGTNEKQRRQIRARAAA